MTMVSRILEFVKFHAKEFIKIFFLFFAVYLIFSICLNIYFKDKIISNIFLGDINLQGQNINQIKNNLNNLDENLKKKNFIINLSDSEKIIAESKYVYVNKEKMTEIIINANQKINLLEYPIQIFKNLFIKQDLTNEVLTYDKEYLFKIIDDKLKKLKLSKQDYNIKYNNEKKEFQILNKRDGIKIYENNFAHKFFTFNNLQKNNQINIYPDREIDIAERKYESVLPFLNEANLLKNRINDLEFYYFSNLENRSKKYIFNREDLFDTLTLKEKDERIFIGIDKEILEEKIRSIEKEIYIKPINGKIEINPHNPKKVTNLILPIKGKEIDINKLILDLEKFDNEKITIYQKEILPEISENDYGIRELLGSGWSNFAGSDVQRLHNINNAVSKLNNLLILPNENFSLAEALAPFTIANGYINGLVIKGKKIIPEVGGGMCQLGTTMFRASMNSGMPITERKNHSLWLKYYNDPKNGNPGTDATIYSNSPDFKFLNDTGKHILIKAYTTKKADLIIELWGTKDGRSGTYTPPKIMNIIEPSKEMETVIVKELKPGEMICNGPFKGASTMFTYIRNLPNGKIEKQDFWSYYKAEPLRCQVGADIGYFNN